MKLLIGTWRRCASIVQGSRQWKRMSLLAKSVATSWIGYRQRTTQLRRRLTQSYSVSETQSCWQHVWWLRLGCDGQRGLCLHGLFFAAFFDLLRRVLPEPFRLSSLLPPMDAPLSARW